MAKAQIRVLVLVGIALAMFATAFLIATIPTHAEVNFQVPTEPNGYKVFPLLNATTTTATSTTITGGGGYALIAGAKSVQLYFTRGDTKGTGNTGSTNFKVQVQAQENGTWFDYNMLAQNLSTSTSPTTVSSVTISAATSTVITSMANLGFFGVRCIAVETTDGDHSCSAAVTY